MKRSIAEQMLKEYPKLVPLSEGQKRAFLFFWNEKKDYQSRQKLVGSIPDLYNNRRRYKELLTSNEDVQMFNAITLDDGTLL